MGRGPARRSQRRAAAGFSSPQGEAARRCGAALQPPARASARLRRLRLAALLLRLHAGPRYFPDTPLNAALKLCTVLLYAEGWRPEKALAHYRTLQALPLILGDARKDDADYLDACRNKRNTAEYDAVGQVSPQEAEELAAFVRELRESVVEWLEQTHPELSPWKT